MKASELARELGKGRVFLDHERIEGASKWPDRLREEARSATIMLALIGKVRLSAQDEETGERRLSFPDDWVRLERGLREAAGEHRQVPGDGMSRGSGGRNRGAPGPAAGA